MIITKSLLKVKKAKKAGFYQAQTVVKFQAEPVNEKALIPRFLLLVLIILLLLYII